MKLLLLSNSSNKGETYMEWCKNTISDFVVGHQENIIFISYAAASFPLQEYSSKVNEALHDVNIKVTGIEEFANPKEAVANASAIFVGGGNTFQLIKLLQDNDLLGIIKEKVKAGTPYVGWSAGSNIAGPTICTTNDMPIVQPNSFDALNLISFQINPHYTEETLPNHGGETRKQRLNEYLYVNRESKVVCLPEATYLNVIGNILYYFGVESGKTLSLTEEKTLNPGDTFDLS
jgi:dipeptidase E